MVRIKPLFISLIVFVLVSLSLSSYALDFSDVGNLISGLISPGDCSVKAFQETCKNCAFTPDGKVNEACANGYQEAGKGCLASTHPNLAAKYPNGECPALDVCVNALKACVAERCPGTDKQDCGSTYCLTCYQDGDRCAIRANLDCAGSAKCGNTKCESEKGENSDTCCTDCNCPQGKECKNNACVLPGTEPKPDVVTTTIPSTGGEGGSEGPPQGLGILWALIHDLLLGLREMCGGGLAAPLASSSIALFLGVPLVLRRRKRY
jgi:hypothetical protein